MLERLDEDADSVILTPLQGAPPFTRHLVGR
jgi:hypothetical protein